MFMWLAASSNCQELRPVNMMAREGAHFAFGVYARLKRIPSLANRSNAGVFTIYIHMPQRVQNSNHLLLRKEYWVCVLCLLRGHKSGVKRKRTFLIPK